MGRLVQQVLPEMLSQIEHSETEPICVIAFDSSADVLMATAAQLRTNKSLNARGGTYMATGIDALIKQVSQQVQSANKADTGAPLRILTLTDGELSDQDVSLVAAGRLRSLLEGRQVNSQVRLNSRLRASALRAAMHSADEPVAHCPLTVRPLPLLCLSGCAYLHLFLAARHARSDGHDAAV